MYSSQKQCKIQLPTDFLEQYDLLYQESHVYLKSSMIHQDCVWRSVLSKNILIKDLLITSPQNVFR